MPRQLPWLQGGSSTTIVTKRPAASSKSTAKRKMVQTPALGSDTDDSPTSPRKGNGDGRSRAPSTSPPPEPLTERFMDEGVEHDDKYRMVEDEFLTTAQKFTVHLHTAEYKRQEKLVKSRKADAISSISRPVTGKMPDETRRKTESINRAKTQRNALESMISQAGKPKDSDDSDDAVDLPYFGTTLHGLMDSPRRKTAYLGKMGSIKSTTRAAAGFKKSSAQLKSSQKSVSESPQAPRYGKVPKIEAGSSTASSDDDDDDLDAPIPAPKLKLVKTEETSERSSLLSSISIPSAVASTKAMGKPPSNSRVKKEGVTESSSGLEDFKARAAPVPAIEKPRISRVELARRHRAQLELEEQKKRSIIPTFLG